MPVFARTGLTALGADTTAFVVARLDQPTNWPGSDGARLALTAEGETS
ncbi:hypothetical protein [Roseovarius sp. Pro17]|nr:hypothetical protein [Roseovarius sp. Pro17]